MAVKKETKIKQLNKRIAGKISSIQGVNTKLSKITKEEDEVKYNKLIKNKSKLQDELHELKVALHKLNL